jgi:hypothetical protein
LTSLHDVMVRTVDPFEQRWDQQLAITASRSVSRPDPRPVAMQRSYGVGGGAFPTGRRP